MYELILGNIYSALRSIFYMNNCSLFIFAVLQKGTFHFGLSSMIYIYDIYDRITGQY